MYQIVHLPYSIYLCHVSYFGNHLVAEWLWLQYLYCRTPAANPWLDFLRAANFDGEKAGTIGHVLNALAMMPGTLFDAPHNRWHKAHRDFDLSLVTPDDTPCGCE